MPELATIGYQGCAIGDLLEALSLAKVTHLVDVRAVPLSRKPGFSKRLLAGAVETRGMRYTHLRGLGTPKAGRDAARHGKTAIMHTIFNAHMQSDVAQADLAHAIDIARTERACLLCFEADHTECHRAIVAELIRAETGQRVRHLAAGPVASP